MFEKILVALDRSDESEKALVAAGNLAALSGGEVRVLHVHEISLGVGGAILPETHAEAETLVNDAVKGLEDKGVIASGGFRTTHSGRVAAAIIEEAQEVGATVVVVGSRGITALEGIILGSVTLKLLHLSKLPMFVAR
jgi:nucleotide-binding universal stress UspA family protein